jgi:hypothetical protein
MRRFSIGSVVSLMRLLPVLLSMGTRLHGLTPAAHRAPWIVPGQPGVERYDRRVRRRLATGDARAPRNRRARRALP